MIATTDEQNEAMALGRPMLKLSDDRLARWQPATISAGARASASVALKGRA